jgi:putative heme-binding domain-containing protein
MSKHGILLVIVAATALLGVGQKGAVAAQVLPRAKLIWFDECDPTRSVPAGTRYFRGMFMERFPVAEAEMHIACDDAFVLFVNGKEVERGASWHEGKVIDLTRLIRPGKNVVAIAATNRGGPAALVAWLARRTVPGNHYIFLTDSRWKCAKVAPENWHEVSFDDSRWSAVKVIGDLGAIGPWPEVTWTGVPAQDGKADLGRLRIVPGFTIDVVAEPALTGSIVRMTFDTKGRPMISRENGPILILDDPDASGKYRKAKEYTRKVKDCQGILAFDATTCYLVGRGPEGTGLYRVRDADGDEAADQFQLMLRFRGAMSEHGPHAVSAGPDGFLYVVCGNHAWVADKPEVNSPVEKMYEGDLLRRYEDPSGHAAGIKVPGGTTWRLDPEGNHLTLENAGFRNHYDIGFNALNEMFTFDSDMELQEFLPFYHPVRVMHCTPGAEFGWRSNDGKWPSYYVDALPALLEIGRGSPTGVVFYNHRQFPREYQDAFLMGDWSYGRILALKLRRAGATFKADVKEFVTGKPLNVTDIGVAPDGSVFFCTGGRSTEGGIYRIRSTSAAAKGTSAGPSSSDTGDQGAVGAAAVQAALDQPQPQSAWGREAIRLLKARARDQWEPELERAASDSHAPAARRIRALSYLMQFGPDPRLSLARRLATTQDPEVRAQTAVLLARHAREAVAPDLIGLLGDSSPIAQRRAAEGLIRTQTRAPFAKLRPLLASPDPVLRYASRLALERTEPGQWRDLALADRDPRVAIMGLVSLNKLGEVAADPRVAQAAFEKELALLRATLRSEDERDTVRSLQLTLINTKPAARPAHLIDAIGNLLLAHFPSGERSLDRELARTLSYLQWPGAIDKLLAALEKNSTSVVDERADGIHYARCLAAITRNWTPDRRLRFLAWFDLSKDWQGGSSYRGHIYYYLRDALGQLTEADNLALVRQSDKFPRAAARAVVKINEKSPREFVPALAALLKPGARSGVPRPDAIAALGRTGSAEAEAVLLRLYNDSSADRNDVACALANFPNARNWPIFVQALDSSDDDTSRAALHALGLIERKPSSPAPYRAVIQAGDRLEENGGWEAVGLLRQWAGKHFGGKKQDWKAELHQWQAWYATTYPDAEAATFVESSKPAYNWSCDQLLAFLEGEGRNGAIETGRRIFEKVNCAKCHRFEQLGGGLGPDLTTLSSRFRRKDILDAVLYPSKVVSDQYKSVVVTTKTGRVISGMKAPDEGDLMVLLLSDASTLKVPRTDVDEIVDSKQSIMPDGLLNQLTLQEIAGLFEFLESGKGTPVAGSGEIQTSGSKRPR